MSLTFGRQSAFFKQHREDVNITAVPPARSAGTAMAGRWLPNIVMAVIVVSWGLGPPVTKLITAPPLTTLFVRLWASVPILLALTYATGGRLTRTSLRRTAPAGMLFGLNLACVFSALHHATVAVVSVMSALQPGLVLVIAALVLKERITAVQVVWTLVGIGGAAVVILGAGKRVHTSALGLTFSILAMITFTVYFLIAKRVRTNTPIGPFEWMTGATLFSAITVTPFTWLTDARHHFGDLAGNDLFELAFVTVVTGIAGHVLMSWVTKYIDVGRSSLYLLAMNVVAVTAAWPLHHEPITPLQALGGAIVLAAVAVVIRRPAAPAAVPAVSRPQR